MLLLYFYCYCDAELLQPSLSRFPEYVPSTGDTAGRYATREAKFWTCGFFPGSLYTLLERCVRFPKSLPSPGIADRRALHDQLLQLCRSWSAPLHAMATRRDTHDLGFIIMPALRLDWELTGNRQSWESILTAAESLASRFDERVGAIRSWDQSFSKRYSITDKEENFLVIIDSMCSESYLPFTQDVTRWLTDGKTWICCSTPAITVPTSGSSISQRSMHTPSSGRSSGRTGRPSMSAILTRRQERSSRSIRIRGTRTTRRGVGTCYQHP